MSVDTRTSDLLQKAFVLVLLIVVGTAFLGMIRGYLDALVMAAIFAGLLQPLQRWLTRRLHGRERLAAVIILVGTLLAIVLPLATLAGIVVSQALDVTAQIRPWVEERVARPGPVVDLLPQWIEEYVRLLDPYRASILNKLAEAASSTGTWLVSNVSTVTQGTIGFLLSLFVMSYALFFFLIDGPRLVAQIKALMPLSNADQNLVLARGLAVTRGSLKGILVIGALQGILVGLGLWAAGLSGAAFWGTITFVLSAVPGIGAPIIWGPAAIYLAISNHVGAAIGLTLWGVIVVGLVDNILRPIIVGRDAKLPDWVVLVAILGGIGLFGVMGIVLGPILAAILDTVVGIYRRAFERLLPE